MRIKAVHYVPCCCPGDDCESVQSQWLESSEYEDFCDLWSGPIAAIAKALTPQS